MALFGKNEDEVQTQDTCENKRVLFKQHHTLQQTIFEGAAALNSTRDGHMGHGFGCGDGSCIDWHQRHVVRVLLALCPLAV